MKIAKCEMQNGIDFCKATRLDDGCEVSLHTMTSSTIRPILERLAYVIYLLLLVGSIGGTWIGGMMVLEKGDFKAVGVALVGLALSRWLHVYGHTHWHFRECGNSLQVANSPEAMLRREKEEQLAVEIEGLFMRLDREDDVWARGELRREIAGRLASAPTLRNDFADRIEAHPGL